jgi:superfamily II DNA or RNA helicase
MTDMYIRNVNQSYVKIDCDQSIGWELRDAFSFRPQGFQFIPSYKQKLWDGYIRMYNPNTKTVYRGLVKKIIKWAEDRGYTYEYPDEVYDTDFSLSQAQSFVENLNPKHAPRDYQMDGFVHAIRSKRKIILSPTGSGKSLLQYMIFMYLMKQGKRGLLIVPRAALVEQMYSDFEDYSSKNGKDMSKYCHRIYSGKEKNVDCPLIISTWQSMQNMPKKYFEQFDYLIVDEVHGAVEKSQTMKVMSSIVANCVNAEYRIGVTGTLPDGPGVDLSLTGLFGDTYKVISSAELMERKQLAELSIKCLLLKYTEEECMYMKNADYKTEINYIVGNNARNQFIVNLALSLEGNTLIFFNFVEKHGDVLQTMLNKKVKEGRKVFYIHGGTDVSEREEIRRIIENEHDAIIVGSVGVLSTGTNIVALDNIIFASPSKSKIRNLQSVGRGLRLSDTKKSATLFDIADDFSHKKRENYTLKHFFERIKTYSEEKFKFKIYKIQLKG